MLIARPALAGEAIGEATDVALVTTIDSSGAKRTAERGGSVAELETILTDKSGKAAFRFVDDTQLSVGPDSKVRLDRFVFDNDNSPSAFAIRASKGLLRFATGKGDHDGYKIQTPSAAIGVRGTQFDVKIDGANVRVSVLEGEVVLCPNGGRPAFADCVEAKAGSTILSTRTRARIVPTSSLPQIRADLLLPLGNVAGILPTSPLATAGLPLPRGLPPVDPLKQGALPTPAGLPAGAGGALDRPINGAAGAVDPRGALGGLGNGFSGAGGGLGGLRLPGLGR